jgi:RNA polymerase subunit RPABC4/transcription elongation factor Spt4
MSKNNANPVTNNTNWREKKRKVKMVSVCAKCETRLEVGQTVCPLCNKTEIYSGEFGTLFKIAVNDNWRDELERLYKQEKMKIPERHFVKITSFIQKTIDQALKQQREEILGLLPEKMKYEASNDDYPDNEEYVDGFNEAISIMQERIKKHETKFR